MKKFITLIIFYCLVACNSYIPTQSNSPKKTAQEIEKDEFIVLMKQDSIDNPKKSAEALDILLNSGGKSNKVSVMINNSSQCNIIVRFAGNKSYSLPIKKNTKNHITIEKGSYMMAANLCSSRFSEQRNFNDDITLTLSEGQ